MATTKQFVLVDVGASGGEFNRWKRICPEYQSVLFEPDKRALGALASENRSRFISGMALSDHRGEIDFHLCRAQPLSSVYPPNSELLHRLLKEEYVRCFDVVQRVRIPCDTLDAQLLEHDVSDIDFIKIDVQGHELAVLHGASQSLRQAIGVEVELGFLEVYKNQPSFAKIDEFLRSIGFAMFDLEKSYFVRRATGYYGVRKGQVIFGIALYFISPEELFERGPVTERKLVNAVVAYLAYGYFDAAEVVMRIGREVNVFSGESYREAEMLVNRFRKRFRMPNFKGKQRIHRTLAKLTRAFGGEGVNYSDLGVGNF